MTIMDGYVDQLKPHMHRVGLTAQAYAERICSRLDLIYESVCDNGVWSDRGLELWYHPAVQTSERITTLGTDDLWVLTSLSRGSTANIGYVRLDQKPVFILAAGETGMGSSAVYIPGPGELTVDTDTTATAVAAQFRRYARRASVNSNRLGFGDPPPEVDRMGVTPIHRHAGAM